jgi:epoxyqueuosine reductase
VTKEEFRAAACDAGFELCGFARAGRAPHADALGSWLDDGCQAGMTWMQRTRDERSDPRRLLPAARTVIVLGKNYFTGDLSPSPGPAARGRIARYAWGADYHDTLQPRLAGLATRLETAGGHQRCFLDGGPVLERDWAAACGVSWHGKSTMGIHPRLGTWFFLSVILTTLEFDPDAPLPDRCGSCTRCIDACPTAAITAPYRLDARRCLSYLTIENKGPIPVEFRRAMGDRIFGCDDCLDACPWNRFAAASRDAQMQPQPGILDRPLRDFLSLDERGFRDMFRGSPILRAKRRGFLRNVCVALGNTGTDDDLPSLHRVLDDPEELVREHAAWAVAEIAARRPPHHPRCSTESR